MSAFAASARQLLLALALALTATLGTGLGARPIEGLPDRDWSARGGGAKLFGRLAWVPEGPLALDRHVLIVPADPARAPVSVPAGQLSLEDQDYLRGVRSIYRGGGDWRELTKTPLHYADATPIPGTFRHVDTLRRRVYFEVKKNETFLLALDSLDPDSIARIRAIYFIPPPLEVGLGELQPLDLRAPTPPRFEVKNVPLEKQEGSYCVPASAVMIAGHHGFRITQKQLAHLSSDASRKHRGTWSGDMARAMEALGFYSETRLWADLDTKEDFARFQREILPFIRHALLRDGPLYVSFKPGVYGPGGGHGCVIVGYNDGNNGSFEIHNPWGRREKHSYRDFSRGACEVVRFHLPPPVSGDSAPLAAKVVAAFPRAPVDLTDAQQFLRAAGLRSFLRFHARHDRREDSHEVERWALAQGPRILRATLARHSACLLPAVREGRIVGWHLLRLEGEDPNPIVRSCGPQGWTAPSRIPLDSLLKTWSTPVNIPGESAWDMPVFEIDI